MAVGAGRIQGGVVCGWARQSPNLAHRSERRHFSCGKRSRTHPGVSRANHRRQARAVGDLCQRAEAAVWSGFLSSGPRSAMVVCGQRSRSRSFPLSQWRFAGERITATHRRPAPWGLVRAQDAAGRIFAGWQANVCRGGLGIERRRSRHHAAREGPRGHSGLRSGELRVARVCLRHSQRGRWDCGEPADGRVVVLGE